jgi:guanylate kinase
MSGLLIVISGPSGVGKGTIIDALVKDLPHLSFSVSATTRPPRQNEQNGVEYFFLSREMFENWIRENRFIEWAKVHGEYYGTPRAPILEKLNAGQDVVLDIDVQGSLQIKKHFPDGVFIFVVPPSFEELKKRLEARNTETQELMQHRLEDAKEELRHMGEYDYLVTNNNLEEAVADIKAIIRAEKCRLKRRLKEIQNALSPS